MILIAGPCVLESEFMMREIATSLKQFDGQVNLYLKASCEKDNRTMSSNFYGLGFVKCIPIFTQIKKEFDIKITTDFHSAQEICDYGHYFDLIQIPAFLARQQSILQAASKMELPIHVKKPQFTDPHDTYKIKNILRDYGHTKDIYITDRGTQFGYDKVMMDCRHTLYMKSGDTKILADITHPNKLLEDSTSLAYILGKSYIASGVDGIFIETHPNPKEALCDADTQIKTSDAVEMIKKFILLNDFMEKLNDK